MKESFNILPFGLDKEEKHSFLLERLNNLTEHHLSKCFEYKLLMEKLGESKPLYSDLENVPFLPVRLFKYFDLLSVPRDDVIKTMTSSGTSKLNVSHIFLDKYTAELQVRILSKIVSDFIGKKRLPMLVIDTRSTVSDRKKFSARTAGILGFSIFGRDIEFALNDDMSLDMDRVNHFIDKHKSENILIFGFTFIVWKHLVLKLESLGQNLSLHQGILIHGGGWKHLEDNSVSNEEFKSRLNTVTGIPKVYNYYGMVEQTGSIFMECEHGYFHTSSFSEVIIRDPVDFSPIEKNKSGLIQLLSIIPYSYPGHSLLSEDVGRYIGVDDCICGRLGKYFKVHGRLESAEIRGCSDTYS
jgi:hypothetical protein